MPSDQTIVMGSTRGGKSLTDADKEFVWRLSGHIILAMQAIGEEPSQDGIGSYLNNIDPLLIAYGETWLKQVRPGRWREELEAIETALSHDPAHDCETPKEFSRACAATIELARRHMDECDDTSRIMEDLIAWHCYDPDRAKLLVTKLQPMFGFSSDCLKGDS